MAYALTKYTGNGNTVTYTIGFDYRQAADVKVKINGVDKVADTTSQTNDYSFPSSNQITFTTAPANQSAITIRRSTSQDARLVDYVAGAVLKEADLDADSTQAFFMAQESIDYAQDAIAASDTTGAFDAGNKKIGNVADPTLAQDAVTKNYLENTWLSSTDKASISTLAANNSAITTINTNMSAITSVNTNETNINTLVSNIGSVSDFANRYRIESTDPSSSLDEGDLVYNSTDNQLKFYNGTSWNAVATGADVKAGVSANDTSPGFLNGKLVAGSNITFVENNDGGNETLTINVTAALFSAERLATTSEAQTGTDNTTGMTPLRVKEAITHNAGTVSNAAFYGFKQTNGVLQVDGTTGGGSEAYTLSDYKDSEFASLGLTFAINSNGHLLVTTP